MTPAADSEYLISGRNETMKMIKRLTALFLTLAVICTAALGCGLTSAAATSMYEMIRGLKKHPIKASTPLSETISYNYELKKNGFNITVSGLSDKYAKPLDDIVKDGGSLSIAFGTTTNFFAVCEDDFDDRDDDLKFINLKREGLDEEYVLPDMNFVYFTGSGGSYKLSFRIEMKRWDERNHNTVNFNYLTTPINELLIASPAATISQRHKRIRQKNLLRRQAVSVHPVSEGRRQEDQHFLPQNQDQEVECLRRQQAAAGRRYIQRHIQAYQRHRLHAVLQKQRQGRHRNGHSQGKRQVHRHQEGKLQDNAENTEDNLGSGSERRYQAAMGRGREYRQLLYISFQQRRKELLSDKEAESRHHLLYRGNAALRREQRLQDTHGQNCERKGLLQQILGCDYRLQ